MNAKSFLDEIYMMKSKIEAKLTEIEILDDMRFRTSKDLCPDKVQTSGTKDSLAEATVRLLDARAEANEMLIEYTNRLREVNYVIDSIEDIKEYELLHKHYIQGLSWTHIAQEWDNSNVWVHEVKKRAFASVQKILDSKN